MNELYHYGVKGMKWGKRKANILNESRHPISSVNESSTVELNSDRSVKTGGYSTHKKTRSTVYPIKSLTKKANTLRKNTKRKVSSISSSAKNKGKSRVNNLFHKIVTTSREETRHTVVRDSSGRVVSKSSRYRKYKR